MGVVYLQEDPLYIYRWTRYIFTLQADTLYICITSRPAIYLQVDQLYTYMKTQYIFPSRPIKYLQVDPSANYYYGQLHNSLLIDHVGDQQQECYCPVYFVLDEP